MNHVCNEPATIELLSVENHVRKFFEGQIVSQIAPTRFIAEFSGCNLDFWARSWGIAVGREQDPGWDC